MSETRSRLPHSWSGTCFCLWSLEYKWPPLQFVLSLLPVLHILHIYPLSSTALLPMIFPAAPVSPDPMERTRPVASRLPMSFSSLESIEECSCGNEECAGHHIDEKEEVGYYPTPLPDALALYSPTSSSRSSNSSTTTFSPLPPCTKLAHARAELLHRLPWSRSASLLCSLPDTGREGEVWRAPSEFVPLHQMHQDFPEEGEGEMEEEHAGPPHRMWRPSRSRMCEVETLEEPVDPVAELAWEDSIELAAREDELVQAAEEDELVQAAREAALEQAATETILLSVERECVSEQLPSSAEREEEKDRRPRFWERKVLGFQLTARRPSLRSTGRSQSTSHASPSHDYHVSPSRHAH
ncbi:hypothetical protein CALVIDRAFT_597412, partial [Calocera viscosa TUFC12733]